MMTPRSRKPVLLISRTNIKNIPNMESKSCPAMDSVEEGPEKEGDNIQFDSLSEPFRQYLSERTLVAKSLTKYNSSSNGIDHSVDDLKNLSESKISSSMLHCLNGYVPLESSKSSDTSNSSESSMEEKQFVLKPKQFDENGKAIIYETSF